MSWTIELYETVSGNQLVADFIASLKPREQAKVARAFDLLEEFGPGIGRPWVERLSGGEGLWALRVPFGGQAFRFLFFKHGNVIVVVHGFSKKSAKIPLKELHTAIERMKDYKARRSGTK